MEDIKSKSILVRLFKMNLLGKLSTYGQVSSSLCGHVAFSSDTLSRPFQLPLLDNKCPSVDAPKNNVNVNRSILGIITSHLVQRIFQRNTSCNCAGALCNFYTQTYGESGKKAFSGTNCLTHIPLMAWFCYEKNLTVAVTSYSKRDRCPPGTSTAGSSTLHSSPHCSRLAVDTALNVNEESRAMSAQESECDANTVNNLAPSNQICDKYKYPPAMPGVKTDQQTPKNIDQASHKTSVPGHKTCKNSVDNNQKKKKRPNRPSKKKRIRLLVRQGICPKRPDDSNSASQNTSVKFVVDFNNISNAKNSGLDVNSDYSQKSETTTTCSKFSFFISGADVDSCDSDNSDFEDTEDNFESDLWNTLSQAAFTPLKFDHEVKVVCRFSSKSKSSTSYSGANSCPVGPAVHEANKKWRSYYGDLLVRNDNCDSKMKVTFSKPEGLAMTKVFDDDLGEERKGPWEEMARDRARFEKRIRDSEQTIGLVFTSSHRQFIRQSNLFVTS